MQPKVSVIIPVYNVEKYLESCLDSVLTQTLPPSELEIICVNDGSTDSSPQILARCAAAHAHIRIIHQSNGGLSAARNAGLDAASGEYIYFLDSDDRLIRDDALEALYVRAVALDLDELRFNSQIRFADESLREGAPENPYCPSHSYPDVYSGQTFFAMLAENGDYACVAWLRLYRRAFLEEHGLRFLPGIVHEDEVFSLECLSLERRATHLNLCLHEQLCRPDSIMTAKSRTASIRGDCLGARALEDFAADRLSDADAVFMRRYRELVWAMRDRAVRDYLALTHPERRKFLRGLPPSERAEVEIRLHSEIRRRKRKARRLALKRHMPNKVWSAIRVLVRGGRDAK